jgi:DNA-binding NarL/FixJ family response regulator
MTRAVVLSEIRLYREGLAVLLAGPDLEIVGTAGDGAAGLGIVAESPPDIVLVDMAMTKAMATVRALQLAAPTVPIVALGVSETERDVIACAEAGVSGYVTREDSLADLVAALESVSRGEMLCSPGIAAALRRRVTTLARRDAEAPVVRLTPRELEIVELIDRGLSNKEIAARLFVTVHTVEVHLSHAYAKLGVRSRSQLAGALGGQLKV